MPIAESEISILIPTYRYRDKVVRAVESALASGAGEIIVTDDCSQDGTIERLATYSDPRLIVRENERNLGLWENHLNALNLSSRPWIKFIQADDYLLPGGLAAYAAAVEDGVTVVFGAPTVKDDLTGEVTYYHRVDRPRRVAPADLRVAFLFGGWILGSPSHMMLRADSIERDPAAWRTRVSADLVVGAISAARGDTILLPAGAIGQGSHPLQDAKTQSAMLGLERVVASLAYLRRRPEPGLRWLANMWTWLQLTPVLRTMAKGLLRRENPATTLAAHPWHLLTDLSIADWREIHANRKLLRAASDFRKTSRAPFEPSRFLDAAYGTCRSIHLRGDETTTEPGISCSLASDSAVETLCCPTHHVALSRRDNDLMCPDCGRAAGRWKGPVASFLPKADTFYEGKYNNRTRYVPKNDGYLATLPLRIVHQGYPTAVAKALPKGSTVVEIGCAGGIDWYGQQYRMIGLDLSEGALQVVARQYALAVQCDATRMPLASASVDGIISSCLFEHLLPEQKADLLRESHRVLKPGGKLVFFYDIQTDNPIIAAYRRRRPDLYQTLFLDGDGHLGYDTVEANRRHFVQAGFKIVGEAFHERTPLLANSAWQKLSQWPGALGIAAVVGRTLTSGLARLPSLAAIAIVDVMMAPLFPQRFARGMTTVARKP